MCWKISLLSALFVAAVASCSPDRLSAEEGGSYATCVGTSCRQFVRQTPHAMPSMATTMPAQWRLVDGQCQMVQPMMYRRDIVNRKGQVTGTVFYVIYQTAPAPAATPRVKRSWVASPRTWHPDPRL